MLTNGQRATAVIVGPRTRPKGAGVVVPGSVGEQVETFSLDEALDLLHPSQAIEIYAMQERLHGASGLPRPTFPKNAAP